MDFRGIARRDRQGVRPGSKLQYAQYLSTALAHVISRGQDQVGLALLDRQLRSMLPPGATLTHLNQLYASIEAIVPRPTTTMAPGLRELFERCRRRGVLLLISDFLMDDLEEVFGVLRLFRHRGWEVIILHLVHPEEERLPEAAAFRFEGMEAEGRVDCSPAEIRAIYRDRFAAHLAMVRQLALAGACDYRRVSTAIPYLQTLGGFLGGTSGFVTGVHDLSSLLGNRDRGRRGRRAAGHPLADQASARAHAALHAAFRPRSGPPAAGQASAPRSAGPRPADAGRGDARAGRGPAVLRTAAAGRRSPAGRYRADRAGRREPEHGRHGRRHAADCPGADLGGQSVFAV